MLFIFFVTLIICIIYPILIPIYLLGIVAFLSIAYWGDKKKIERYKRTGNF